MKKWWQSKTVWTGIAGLVAAVGGYATGELGLGEAAQLAITAGIGIFLRDALMKQ